MTNRNSLLLITAALISLLIMKCVQQVSGVETTNGATVSVSAHKVEGKTMPFAGVYLCDKNYIPYIDNGIGVATAADKNGDFLFNDIAGEKFSVAIITRDNSETAFFCAGCDSSNNQIILSSPGKLEGSVTTSLSGPILVFLRGTGYYMILESSGSFVFDALPQGVHQVQAAIISKGYNESKPVVQSLSLPQEVNVKPGSIVKASLITIP